MKEKKQSTQKKNKRKCSNPKCDKIIEYISKKNCNNAKKKKTLCRSCLNSGKNNSMYGILGENNPNFGSKRSEKTKKKMSNNHADFSGKNNPMFEKIQSEKSKGKMRVSAIKRIKNNNNGRFTPNYNSGACKIIDWFNMYYDFNFKHAENGGEVCVGGYYPDGLDEKRKTIIEVDEKKHFNSDGNLKERDVQRHNYLEDLGYKFIRIKI